MTDQSEVPQAAELAKAINDGWVLHVHGQDEEAEIKFRQALSENPDSIEALYGLGIVLKAFKRYDEMVEVFKRVVQLLETQEMERARAEMLRRLAKGHIAQVSNGDWGMEGEIWKRSD